MNLLETDVLVVGAGLAGLAAASVLGERALVVEAAERAGGLVRTEYADGFWFDHCVHLLYFDDEGTEARVRTLLGSDLAPCPPVAWVDTSAGTARFPIQGNLRGLTTEARVACLRDLARECYAGHEHGRPAHFEEMLRRSFGPALCELFFFPYNRKLWKRPLAALAPSGFQWNIARPNYESALRGALPMDDGTAEEHAYNAKGWYPRPAPAAPYRGIEVLARALAESVPRLLTGHTVVSLDPARREARLVDRVRGETRTVRYRHACAASGPLPRLVELCSGLGDEMQQDARSLRWNRVRTVALGIRGERPHDTGHWRYYPDEGLSFTRLVFPCAFDPDLAPPGTWSVLAEITEAAESPPSERDDALAERARRDMRSIGMLRATDEVLVERVFTLDPAYVVFEPGADVRIRRLTQALLDRRVHPLGRYGRWEYSSMAQVMRDGFAWGERMLRDMGPT